MPEFDPEGLTEAEILVLLDEVCSGPGKGQAWDDLYNNFRRLISGTVYNILRNGCITPSDHTEDVTQEAWQKIAYALDKYDSSKGAFGAWAYTVAFNRAQSHLKKCASINSSLQSLDDENSTEDLHFRLVSPSTVEAAMLIAEIYGHLKPEDQRLLRLATDGYSMEEISESLGLSPSNVKVKLFRIRAKLKEFLG